MKSITEMVMYLESGFDSEYKEDDDSTFESEGVSYNLNKIFPIAARKSTIDVPISMLDWVIPYCTLDPKRVAKADYRLPIIITDDPTIGKCVVVDGAHRLQKAINEGQAFIRTKSIAYRELQKARIN